MGKAVARFLVDGVDKGFIRPEQINLLGWSYSGQLVGYMARHLNHKYSEKVNSVVCKSFLLFKCHQYLTIFVFIIGWSSYKKYFRNIFTNHLWGFISNILMGEKLRNSENYLHNLIYFNYKMNCTVLFNHWFFGVIPVACRPIRRISSSMGNSRTANSWQWCCGFES